MPIRDHDGVFVPIREPTYALPEETDEQDSP